MLEKVTELVSADGRHLEELNQYGKAVLGYFCSLTPVEIIDAAGLIPYRITGDPGETISEADVHLETIMCPFVRSCFDIALKGRYDFLDGIVVPHSCDSIERLYNIWRRKLEPPYSHFITVPHVVFESSYDFFREELVVFKESLQRLTGSLVSDDDLRQAIMHRNEQRALLRDLYELRKQDPPLITGTEVTYVLLAVMKSPVKESIDVLRDVIAGARSRTDVPPGGSTRVMVVGSEVDDVNLIRTIEESGASVVMDDTCVGSRNFWQDVATDIEPLEALSHHYLGAIYCPRTYREGTAAERFRYLTDYAKEFNCKGVILDIIQYCDTYELDVPGIRDYLEGVGLKVLVIDDAYSAAYIGQLKTRVQAFLELISQGD